MKTPATPTVGAKQKGRPSKVTAFAHLLGKVPDAEIMKLSGATKKAVEQYRLKRHIPAFVAPRTRDALPAETGNALVVATAAVPAGAAPKAPAAKKAATARKKAPAPAKAKKGTAAKSPAPKPDAKAPNAKKAPAAKKAAPKKRGPSNNKGKKRGWAAKLLAKNRHIVGVQSDQEIATRLGMSSEAVRQWRRKEGIMAVSAGAAVALAKPPVAKALTGKAATKAPAVKAPVAAKAARATAKAPPASTPAKASPTKRVEAFLTTGATSTVWKVSVRGSEAVHIVADTLSAAALRVEKALGTSAISIEFVGPGIG